MQCCARCGKRDDPRAMIRVLASAVHRASQSWRGLPNRATITICSGCRQPDEPYWSNCD